MKYLVMKRITLEAFQKGYSKELEELFYEYAWTDHEQVMRHKWTKCVGVARVWSSEQSAWDYVIAHWGMKFSHTNFLVVAAHQEAIEHSARDKDKIIHGKEAL